MIRFLPDTWADALLRPLAMAAPSGWVYTEIAAPDFRFIVTLVLASCAVGIALFGRRLAMEEPHPSLVWALFALTWATFIIWIATTGNGRYFMPFLLLSGPLCIGLIVQLPITRSARASLAILLLAVQGVALSGNNPWRPFDSWTFIRWEDSPYFQLDVSQLASSGPVTYITVGSNSFSAVAPLLGASARWINLSVFGGIDLQTSPPIYKPVERILQNSVDLRLFHHAQPREFAPGTDFPSERAVHILNSILNPHGMALKDPRACILLRSRSLAQRTLSSKEDSEELKAKLLDHSGFWVCPLIYPVERMAKQEINSEQRIVKSVFEKLESLCPRFFPPGQTSVGQPSAPFERGYSSSDSSLTVTVSGDVYLKYARALNSQRIASTLEVLSEGFKLDCNQFRGRSGLPWEREI
jgi:hypothetical protein